MNEKQKRKLLKKAKQGKAFTYKEAETMAREFANKAITSYIACSMLTLREEFKFGKDRLERFLSKESDNAQMMVDKRFSSTDVFAKINEETKFDFYTFLEERTADKEGLMNE
ncbi:hypothetical protein [Jeotgalibaca porci]|uniref:hypothetical protein n=1 Tax=Jeotgalibaca porci TaxID=1868793 RepID=UPI00359F74BB